MTVSFFCLWELEGRCLRAKQNTQREHKHTQTTTNLQVGRLDERDEKGKDGGDGGQRDGRRVERRLRHDQKPERAAKERAQHARDDLGQRALDALLQRDDDGHVAKARA